MRFRSRDWDFICTKCKKEGMYDLIIYNPLTKELFEEYVSAEYISGVDSYGEPYSSAEISRQTFDIISKKLFKDNGASIGFFDNDDDEISSEEDEGEAIPKETVFKAIKGELSDEELDKIVQVDLECADYYNFDAFMDVIHKFLRGEISREYYLDWTILVAWALGANSFKENSKKGLLYENLSDCFDGHSFDELDDAKEQECGEMIARLKYYDHLLNNIKKANEPLFYNKGKVAVCVCFHYCNHYNEHYELCVADEKKKVFKIASIANPFYLESVNYTFVDMDTFDDFTSKYYDFYHDRSIDIHKYIRELPYLDIEGNIIDSI